MVKIAVGSNARPPDIKPQAMLAVFDRKLTEIESISQPGGIPDNGHSINPGGGRKGAHSGHPWYGNERRSPANTGLWTPECFPSCNGLYQRRKVAAFDSMRL